MDAATGRRPGWCASLLWWPSQPPQILVLVLSTSSRVLDRTTRLRSVEPEVAALRRRFGHDRPRLNEAMIELYRSRGVDPWRESRPILVATVISVRYSWDASAGGPSRRS